MACGPVCTVSVLTDSHPNTGAAPGDTAAALACHTEAGSRHGQGAMVSPGPALGVHAECRGAGCGVWDQKPVCGALSLGEAGQLVPVPSETQFPPGWLR